MLSWPTPPFDEPGPPQDNGQGCRPSHRAPLTPPVAPASTAADKPLPKAENPPSDYGSFFRITLAPLRRYLTQLIGSHDEAQDIAQDAYAKVFTVMRERPVRHPRALLYTTARNLAIDELRHRARSPFDAAPTDTAPCTSAGIEATVMAREEADLLAQAIEQLPEPLRSVLLLRTGEHLTHEQVALRLGLTKKQAEKRLHRAVRLLHQALNTPPANPP